MYDYKCTLEAVVDGDTADVWIDLGFSIQIKRRVRLLGINAPELHGETAEAGQRAATALFELLKADGLTIHTQLDRNDKYGRVLGTFLRRDFNVNQAMIQNGYAAPYMVK